MDAILGDEAMNQRDKAIAAIPKVWITRDMAIRHIMGVENCSREDAEEIYEEFATLFPECVKTVSL